MRPKSAAGFILLVALLILHLASSAAVAKLRIGVLDLEPKGGVREDITEVISEQVRMEFAKDTTFVMTEREKIRGILDELGFGQSACVTQQCVLQVGKLTQAEKMVTGSLGNLESKYILSLRVVDVETGSWQVSDQEQRVLPVQDLDKLVPPLVARIARRLKGETVEPKRYNSIRIALIPQELIIKNATIIMDEVDTSYMNLPGVTEDIEIGRHSLKIDSRDYFGSKSFDLPLSPSPYSIQLRIMRRNGNVGEEEYNSVRILPRRRMFPHELVIKGVTVILDDIDTFYLDLPGLIENVQIGEHHLTLDSPEYFGSENFKLKASPSPYKIEPVLFRKIGRKTNQKDSKTP
jgi:hypothetical protein